MERNFVDCMFSQLCFCDVFNVACFLSRMFSCDEFFFAVVLPHVLRMYCELYMTIWYATMFMVHNSVLCRLRSSCYAVMRGTRSVYKLAVRLV